MGHALSRQREGAVRTTTCRARGTAAAAAGGRAVAGADLSGRNVRFRVDMPHAALDIGLEGLRCREHRERSHEGCDTP